MAKKIRFIDSSYNTRFYIEDGASIDIITPEGETHTYKCEYLDPYHTQIGTRCFHICEFAEIMERNGRGYFPHEEENQ